MGAHNIPRLAQEQPQLLIYPDDAHILSGNSSSILHKDFLAHMSDYAWEQAVGGPCVVYKKQGLGDRQGRGRFSVKFFGTTWRAWNTVNGAGMGSVEGNQLDDGQVLTEHTTANGLKECMYTPLTASRWNFGAKGAEEDVLRQYWDLVRDS